MNVQREFVVTDSGIGVELRCNRELIQVHSPVRVLTTNGEVVSRGYDQRSVGDSGSACSSRIELLDGTVVDLTDEWRPIPGGFAITRSWRIEAVGKAAGIRFELAANVADTGTGAWQHFISGCLYNRNDTDLDGVEDYLGGSDFEFRDDKNGHLAVLTFRPEIGSGFCLSRTSVPGSDPLIPDAQRVSGMVVAPTDIGSLGLTESVSGVQLRAGFPFAEPRGYSLDVDGRGWAGYIPIADGATGRVEYELWMLSAPDLSEAIWTVCERQRERLGTSPTPLPMSLEDLEALRFELVQQSYRVWDDDPRRPAGYMIHFSPRDGKNLGSLLEFGFTGAQTLLALGAIRRGWESGEEEWLAQARSVIDFFADHCQSDNGYSEGLYDTSTREFVHWFTGILMPFQYAHDAEDLVRRLGVRMTNALGPIASQLRDISGNYLRTMCEAVYAVLRAYEEEQRHGVVHDNWLRAGIRLGDFLLRTQAADGSWSRAYSPSGDSLTTPAEWFGAGAVEQRSGTIFPVPVLATMHRITGDERYAVAALRAADFIATTYVAEVLYCGGLNDTAMIKSVKIDSTGVLFAMRALIRAYQLGGREHHLAAAVKAAKVAASWLFAWDVPFAGESFLGRIDFRTTGWAVCDAIPGGSYVEDVFLEFVGDLTSVAVEAQLPRLVDSAQIVLHGMQQGLSTPEAMLGYAAPGVQCEGVMTSYLLAAPEDATFSGAVGKPKGEDNDTCNGFVNAAAMYGLRALRDDFGTTDLAKIRHAMAIG